LALLFLLFKPLVQTLFAKVHKYLPIAGLHLGCGESGIGCVALARTLWPQPSQGEVAASRFPLALIRSEKVRTPGPTLVHFSETLQDQILGVSLGSRLKLE